MERPPRGRWAGALAFVVAIVLMASCSASGPSSEGASPSPTSSRPAGSPTPKASSGAAGTNLAEVSVTTDRAVYQPGEVIHAVIRNEGRLEVYAASGQAYCTIVALERSTGGGWRPVAPCAQGAPPGLVVIAPGESLPLDIPPPGSSTDELVAGTYRLRCSFAIGSLDGPSGSARSPTFTVGV